MSDLDIPISPDHAGLRVDQALARLRPDLTRSLWQKWISEGRVRVNGQVVRKRHVLKGGEVVQVSVPDVAEIDDSAQPIPLDICYEDSDILVVNKPPGLVVHPGAGNPEGTLLNALLHHGPEFRRLPRAGIVHRLDKETSGLLVVAKTEAARQSLIGQLQDRTMSRQYQAIVNGILISGKTVDAPIGRSRVHRTRMTVTGKGRPATSHLRVLRKFRAHTLVQVSLESGRTHQIRVHLAHIRFPIAGDTVYGGRRVLPKGASQRLQEALTGFRRQALHAGRLELSHPTSGQRLSWEAPLPGDMRDLVAALEADSGSEEC